MQNEIIPHFKMKNIAKITTEDYKLLYKNLLGSGAVG